MNETYGHIVIFYPEAAAIRDPKTGTYSKGQQLAVMIKAMGDEKEYSFQLPISADLPGEQQLEAWRKANQLIVVSASSVGSTSFEHMAKDENGEPKKYPKPGKLYKVANKTIEIGTMVTFQAYGVREATSEDEARAKVAQGRYAEQQQLNRMRSIEGRQVKAEARAQKRITDASKTSKGAKAS